MVFLKTISTCRAAGSQERYRANLHAKTHRSAGAVIIWRFRCCSTIIEPPPVFVITKRARGIDAGRGEGGRGGGGSAGFTYVINVASERCALAGSYRPRWLLLSRAFAVSCNIVTSRDSHSRLFERVVNYHRVIVTSCLAPGRKSDLRNGKRKRQKPLSFSARASGRSSRGRD